MSINKIIYEAKSEHNGSLIKLIYQICFNSSTNAIFTYRIAKYLYLKGHKIIPIILKRKLERNYGFYISFNSIIGFGLRLTHVTSIVIGDGVKIGENVTIYQQVTLGGQKIGDSKLGNYPTLEDNVVVYAGAKIIGKIKIGEGAIIGANSVVTKDVEPYSVYAGIPAKKIR